jgi:hypothetical protein
MHGLLGSVPDLQAYERKKSKGKSVYSNHNPYRLFWSQNLLKAPTMIVDLVLIT